MRRAMVATVLGAALLAAAGCGGSDSESADTTATETTATETETVETETTTDGGATETTGGGSNALFGSVGPGFEITVDETEVGAGTYSLAVNDESSSHNFHLTGPGGIDVSTEVSGTGLQTFIVDLEPGTYTFVCDPHSSSMTGTITVT